MIGLVIAGVRTVGVGGEAIAAVTAMRSYAATKRWACRLKSDAIRIREVASWRADAQRGELTLG